MQRLYVLAKAPWRENDWRLDVFSEQGGRQSLLLNRPVVPPAIFVCYQGAWPSSDLAPLKGLQPLQAHDLNGNALFCGLYLNELLVRLLPNHEAHLELFSLYQQCLVAFSQAALPDPWLRLFEWQLLQRLGYGFRWHQDEQGADILPQQHYVFVPRRGFVASATGFLGQHLLAFAQGERALPVWQVAKQVLRLALDDLLDRPLVSRELFVRGRR